MFWSLRPNRRAASGIKLQDRKLSGLPMGISGNELRARRRASAKIWRQSADRQHGDEIELPSAAAYELSVDCGQVIARARRHRQRRAIQQAEHRQNLKKFERPEHLLRSYLTLKRRLCGKDKRNCRRGGNQPDGRGYLSQTASKVHMLVRAKQLSDTMSPHT